MFFGKIKGSIFVMTFIAFLIIGLGAGNLAVAETDYLAGWEDHRFDFFGEIYIFSESSLESLYSPEELEEMTLYFPERELAENDDIYYSEEERDELNDYIGSTLSYEEVLQLSENYTLIAVNAHRPFDPDTSHQRARIDISEVVSIGEGKILENITSQHFMVSEEQLIFDSSLRVIPDGTGTIVYILPALETEYVNVEMRSFLENKFIRHTVTVLQQ